ncbi:hypothetical protein HC026_11975 [Lactobacillus sp. LC28-10]|uniref:Uncharacterized protein n=1 Tax=Secundilactobacillus angelensis TaxID=2722706 RepID=A0ABX1L2C4_9LACO|nr:hypothetical protein [Secundilactobacillus angelensis]MCH5463490.1 hypothetical protein [Secundilactobacillus angelensis]NLR19605.1 hypothetical protein [Secundilactobacillus angelensis]
MNWTKIKLIYGQGEQSQKMLDSFVDQYGFNRCSPYYRVHHLDQLLNGERSYNRGRAVQTKLDRQNVIDHGELFKVNGTKRVVLVSHNYQTYRRVREMFWCVIDLGLRAVVFDSKASYYNQGETIMTLVMSKSTYQYYRKQIISNPNLIYII